jgi:hypothetical protein
MVLNDANNQRRCHPSERWEHQLVAERMEWSHDCGFEQTSVA